MPSAKIYLGKELWVVAALRAFAAARLFPTLDALTPVSQFVVGATAAGTILWVTEALPLGLTALLVTVLLEPWHAIRAAARLVERVLEW